jgi:hypothetical protein
LAKMHSLQGKKLLRLFTRTKRPIKKLNKINGFLYKSTKMCKVSSI